MSSIPALAPRDRYTAPERCTYLNQASLGLIPVPAIDAMESFLKSSGLSRPQFGQVNIGASLRPGSLWALADRCQWSGPTEDAWDSNVVRSGAEKGCGDRAQPGGDPADRPATRPPWRACRRFRASR